MASLRLPCPPSTPYFSGEHHQIFHKPPPLSPLYKAFNQANHAVNTNNSFSFSCALSLSHTRILPIKTYKISRFSLHFSSTTQDPVVDSSLSQSEVEAKTEQEEYSRTRVLASNVPWTATTEDIRTLFEKFGTVVDVEVIISLFLVLLYGLWFLCVWLHGYVLILPSVL